MSATSAFLEATMRMATPLLFASAGELLVERAGLINVGLEGIILAGAFGALVGASHGGVAAGVAVAVIAGAGVAVLFLAFTLYARTDQIVTGTAVTLFSLGATGALYRALYGTTGAALTIPTMQPVAIPGLSALPGVGSALFAQPVLTYCSYLLIPVLWWFLYRRHEGIGLRAAGEAPHAAEAAGVPVVRVRAVAILVQGSLGGLAGATLVLAQAGTFAEGMSAGRGFIAIAIVVLGRWHPVGILIASIVFGGATALQFLIQSLGLPIPYHLVLAVPYALTLFALAGAGGRARAPTALARGD